MGDSKGDSYFDTHPVGDIVEAKEIFRKVLGRALSAKLQIPIFANSNLTIHLQMCHPESEQDFSFLTQIPEAGFQLRKVREKGEYKLVGDNISQVAAALKRVPAAKFRR